MILPRTLLKKKGCSNNIENPFLVSCRHLYYVSQKKNAGLSSGEIVLLYSDTSANE